MNLKELKAEIQHNIDDPNAEKISDDNLRLMINRAIRKTWNELVKNGIYLKKRGIDLNFVSGTQETIIDATDVVGKVVCVVDEDGNEFDVVEEEFAKHSRTPCFYISRQTTTSGVAAGSNTRNDKLGYYIVPEFNFTVSLIVNDVATEFGSATSSGATLMDIPEDHHDCIVTWATIQILMKEEEPVDNWITIWNDQLGDLIEAVGMQNKNQQAVVDTYGD